MGFAITAFNPVIIVGDVDIFVSGNRNPFDFFWN